MFKLVVSIIIASIAVLFFEPYLAKALIWLGQMHQYLYQSLQQVFSTGKIGDILRNIVTLLFIPFIVSGVPSLVYYLIYKKKMAYFNEITWGAWLVMATIIILQ